MEKFTKILVWIIATGFFFLAFGFSPKSQNFHYKKCSDTLPFPAIENTQVNRPDSSIRESEKTSIKKWEDTFLFVRDQIRFEPKEVILKTSQGVLWSRKGNAREQALLLAQLLREDGEEVRYAFGSLDDDKARLLIKSMFPERRDFSYSDDVPLSYPSQKKELTEIVKNHCWVQISKNDQWIDLDPCFPDAEVGQAPANLEITSDYIDEEYLPNMVITLEVEKGRFEENRVFNPETESVFEWEETLQEISNQPLYLKIIANIQAEEEEEKKSPMGGLMGGLAGRKSKDKSKKSEIKNVEYLASLHLIDDELDRGSFSQTISDEEEAEEGITKITLKFKMENLDREPMVFERPLFEKFKKDQQPHYFQRHSILITGNEIPMEAWERDLAKILDNEKLDELKKNLDAIRNQLKDKKDLKALLEKSFSLENKMGPKAGHLINMIYASTSDRLTNDLAEALSIFSYYTFPRIIINTFEGTGEKLQVCLDLRQNSREAIPYPGQAERMKETFLYGRGVIESILEGKVIELLTGNQPLTTAHLMQIAVDKDIPIQMFSYLEKDYLEALRIPFSIAQKAKSVIDSGHILIIPEKSIEFDGEQRWGWWDLNPQNGEVVGVLDSGLHQAVLERTILDKKGMLHDDMGLVIGAITGCVDTYWVLSALILKHGKLDKAALEEAKAYMKNIGNYLCPELDKTVEGGAGVSVTIEIEDCWKKEIGIGIGYSAGVKIDQGWCAKFTKGFKCASTSILNFYLKHAE